MNTNSIWDLLYPPYPPLPLSLWLKGEFSLPFNTSEDVTQLCISIIIIFIIVSIGFILFCFLKNIKEYYTIKKEINAFTDNINKNFCPVRHPAFKKFFNELTWKQDKPYSSVPAEEYFNEETLIGNLSKSRLLPLFVTILTGLGVLGTFLGLTIGLKGLTFEGSSLEIAEQIKQMTACASTAFVTSVWGVCSSLLLSLILRICSATLSLFCVRNIQKLVTQKFPLYSPVDSFMIDVVENLCGSKDTLDHLAEEIGNRMQSNTAEMLKGFGEAFQKYTVDLQRTLTEQMDRTESLNQKTMERVDRLCSSLADGISQKIGTAIHDSIGEAMLPAVKQLVAASADVNQRAMNSSEETMKVLLEHFIGEVGSAGTLQKENMEKATRELQQALQDSAIQSRQLFEALTHQQEEQAKEVHNNNKTLIRSLEELLTRQQQNVENLENSLKGSTTSAVAMVDKLKILQESTVKNVEFMQTLSKELEILCTEIKNASISMENMSTNIDTTMRHVSTSIAGSVVTATNLMEQSKYIGESFSESSEHLQKTSDTLEKATESFSQTAIGTAQQYAELSKSYIQMQNTITQYAEEMHRQVEEIMNNYNTQVEQMLHSYTVQVKDQTAERLRAWDEETRRFCSSMTDIVDAMGEVLEEREKLS